MPFTLNQIIETVEGYVVVHKQMNTFQFGDPWEFAESEEVVYPALFMVNGNVDVTEREATHNFQLIFADRIVDDNPANINAQENEVLSDMREVAFDFLALLHNPANRENFTLNKSANMQPFTERFKDLTAGWVLNIQIRQPMLYDRCQVPQT